MQASGFESLDGFQDMRKGIEIATLIGSGVEALGSDEHDTFVSADIYTAHGSPRAFGAVEVMAEGRRPESGGEWDGILASGRAVTYLKPAGAQYHRRRCRVERGLASAYSLSALHG